MPLQIRRGTDAERLGSFTPVEGELIYTTDTKKLYVGDGATVGGVAIDTVSSGGGGGCTLSHNASSDSSLLMLLLALSLLMVRRRYLVL